VVGGEQRIQVAGAQLDLVALRRLHARAAFGRIGRRRRPFGRDRQVVKQCSAALQLGRRVRLGLHGPNNTRFRPRLIHMF
jgi:hypothetical protein